MTTLGVQKVNVLGGLPERQLTPILLELAEREMPGAKLIAALRKDQLRAERVFRPELIRVFVELGIHVATVANSKGDLLIEARSQNETNRINTIVAGAGLSTWAVQKLKPLFEKHWRRVAKMTFMVLDRENVPVTLRSALEKTLLREGGTRAGLVDIIGDTKSALFHVLDTARKEGLNPRVAGKLIKQYVPEGRFINAGARYRAEMIARTETLEAQRVSSIQMYKDSPEIKKVVAFDGDGDEICITRNGEEFSFEEAETEADETHPNCVLAFAPMV